jgi:YHS domain-containing protein
MLPPTAMRIRDTAWAVAIDPVSGVPVAIGIVAYRARHAGTTRYFCCAQSRHSFEKKPSRYLEAVREAQ